MKTLKIISGVVLLGVAVYFLAPFLGAVLVGLGWTLAPVLVAGLLIKIVYELAKQRKKNV